MMFGNLLKEGFDRARGAAAAGVAAAALTMGVSGTNSVEAAPMRVSFAGTVDSVPASFFGSGLEVGDTWNFTGTSTDPTDYTVGTGLGAYVIEDVTIELGSEIRLAFTYSNLSAGSSIGIGANSMWLADTQGDLLGNVLDFGSLAFLNPTPAPDNDSLTSVFNALQHGGFSDQNFILVFAGGNNTIFGTVHTIEISPVPEPSSLALAGAGIATAAGALAARRRQKAETVPTPDL